MTTSIETYQTFLPRWLEERLNELGVETVSCGYERMDDVICAEIEIKGHRAYIRGDYVDLKSTKDLNAFKHWRFSIQGINKCQGTLLQMKYVIKHYQLNVYA